MRGRGPGGGPGPHGQLHDGRNAQTKIKATSPILPGGLLVHPLRRARSWPLAARTRYRAFCLAKGRYSHVVGIAATPKGSARLLASNQARAWSTSRTTRASTTVLMWPVPT